MIDLSWFNDPNLRWVLLATMLLGLGSGLLGSFAYLRKQSLMGDVLAHAALPGICIAFMLTGTKSLPLFLLGAAAAGLVATFGIGWITRNSRIKEDTALALVLSVFFGIGIVLLTQIQHSAKGNQSGLDKFLFGQSASMVQTDVWMMAGLSLLLIMICGLMYKEFKLLSFDPGFARGLGFPVALLDQLFMFLIVLAVVVGIQAVGVVLMAAMLITPAVSARYWTNRLGTMAVLSGIIGAVSGFIGTLVSTTANKLPSGPLTVLAATVLFLASVLFGSSKGLLGRIVYRVRAKRELQSSRVVLEKVSRSGDGAGHVVEQGGNTL